MIVRGGERTNKRNPFSAARQCTTCNSNVYNFVHLHIFSRERFDPFDSPRVVYAYYKMSINWLSSSMDWARIGFDVHTHTHIL